MDDFGVTYIIDSNFGKFYQENNSLLPNWWKSALIVEDMENWGIG